jgi:hypothetical protein
LFDLGTVEVGGQVGDEPLGDEQIISGKQDFSHNITIVAIVLERIFGAQVVETIGSGAVVMEGLL